MTTDTPANSTSRRRVLQNMALIAGATSLPAFAQTGPRNDVDAAVQEVFGDRSVTPGRVTVALPRIAENGYSVPTTLTVDSPMIADDHVKRLVLFSSRNPEVKIAEYKFGLHSGRAQIATRIRLAGTQKVRAVAEMNDGTLWSGEADTLVTLAACVVM